MIVQHILPNRREVFFCRILQKNIKPAVQDFQNMLIDSYVKLLRCFSHVVSTTVTIKFIDDVFFPGLDEIFVNSSIQNFS